MSAHAAADPGLRALFEAEGILSHAGADRPFLLHGDDAWLVEAGRVDVFAVRVADGRPDGARRHLLRVEVGDPLVAAAPVAEGTMGLLAVGSAGTRLLRLPQARLRERAATGGAEARALIERWVHALCAGVSRDLVPRRCDDLEAGAAPELAAGASVRPVGVLWVRHAAGRSLLLGHPGLELNGDVAVPLAPPAWLTAATDARLAPALPAPPSAADAWAGLARLHALVLSAASALADQAAEAERERFRRRAQLSRSVLARACARLVSVVDAGGKPGREGMRLRAGDEDEDAFFAACRLVGGALGIAVRAPASPGGGLSPVARVSGFRVRRVMLRDDWWRRDGGPLLGYVGEEKRPVALLPVSPTRYEVCDPAARTREVVDEATAGTLAPFAHAFYRPFAPEPVGLWGVLKLGIRGLGRDVTAVAATSAAGALLALAVPIATGLVFDSVIPDADRGRLVQLVTVLLAVAVAGALFHLTRAIALTRIDGKMGAAVQAAVWDRLLSLPPTFFRAWTAGDLSVRALGIDALRQALSGAAVTGMVAVLFAVFNLALLFHYNAGLAMWAAGLSALAMAVTLVVGWAQLGRERAIYRLQSQISGMVLQFLTGISKLRVAAAEVHAFSLWSDRFAEQRRLRYRVRTLNAGLASFNAAFPLVASLAIFAAAAPAAEAGTLRTGDFLAFMAAFGTLLGSMLSISGAAVALLAAVPQYENARPILETLPETDAARADPGPLSGDISLRHVSFRYGLDAAPILNDLSLEMKAGEFVALVGPSGSGKSTLLRLLLGFEQPESGSIYYDGQELGGLDVLSVRRQIGVVLQNGRLMPGDLFTNIVGSSPATLDDAWEAARMAGLDADIRAMPMGMHTVVSEGGTTLSGGQRQRLMIARAVVTRPRILLFDEATSALDNRTQAIVTHSLDQLRATRLVIAHRLSTIVHADRICVLERGTIVQSGTYDELMAAEGPFRELAMRQLA